ncbi:MAG TPA: ATP-binding protein [Miltoncostaeaceae bacterium]|nr:ATP-binding protein [Miltoncostaeaceae bacterium]
MAVSHVIPSTDPLAALDAPAPLDLLLPADTSAPRRARSALARLEGYGLPPERLQDAMVAVSEAVTNAVVHAYAGSGGAVRLKAWARDETLAVVVRDEGCGFDPGSTFRGERTGLGMGVSVMRSVASEMRIVTRPGAGAAVFLLFRP